MYFCFFANRKAITVPETAITDIRFEMKPGQTEYGTAIEINTIEDVFVIPANITLHTVETLKEALAWLYDQTKWV